MANRLAGDLRKGDTFELDGTVQVVVDFQHVKPGKARRSFASRCVT